MSYAPGAPPCIWALRIDPGTKLTLLCSWSRADHQDQQNPKPCTIWFPRRYYHADHPKAGKAMPPAAARDLDVAERTGSTPSAVRKHFTKLRALGLADASGRCVELTPPSQDCPHRGTDCDDTTNPSVASTATTGAETATLGAKAATTGSAHLNPPVPPTPPSPAEVERATPTPSVKPAESGVLDPPSFEARVRAVSEAAYCALDGSSTSRHSWASVMREAQLDLGIDDDGTIEALVLWQAHPREGRPTMGRLWQRSTKGGQGGRDWVRKQLKLGVNNDDPRNMRGSLKIVETGPEIDRTPLTEGFGARTSEQW